jgi:hypothetical protein
LPVAHASYDRTLPGVVHIFQFRFIASHRLQQCRWYNQHHLQQCNVRIHIHDVVTLTLMAMLVSNTGAPSTWAPTRCGDVAKPNVGKPPLKVWLHVTRYRLSALCAKNGNDDFPHECPARAFAKEVEWLRAVKPYIRVPNYSTSSAPSAYPFAIIGYENRSSGLTAYCKTHCLGSHATCTAIQAC